ncbi:MAG: hydrogenase [Candidatus Rifleibacteriota bacterium]
MNNIAALLALTCLFLLGSGRMRMSIRMVAFQGILLGILSVLNGGNGWGIILFASSSIFLKGIILPWLLSKALHRTGARREIEPFVGFGPSIIAGVILLAIAQTLVKKIQVMAPIEFPAVLTVAYFMVFSGLFMLVTRRKAITQTLGFLILENGVYCAGLSLGRELSLLVELGVMLDVFVGIFLMGIMIFHIDREFDHIDTDRFDDLSDTASLLGPDEEIG